MRAARQDAHVTAWVRHYARQLSRKAIADGFKPQALHEYTDPDSNPTHWRIRLKHPGTGDKWIRPLMRIGVSFDLKQPEYPNGTPLYRLHELAARQSEPALIVEGESCADALLRLGILATTSGAADSAGKADWTILAGSIATIWPDNDEAGGRYGQAVKGALESIGCTVAVIDVAKLDLLPKGDCVDWLAAHPNATAADVLALPKIDPSESPTSDDQGAGDTQAPPETVHEFDAAVIARLAALPALEYDRCRVAQAKTLGVRPATLDSQVKAERQDEEQERLPFKEHEPCADPVDPAALLSELSDTIRRFIVLDKEQADAAALWAALTHFIDAVEVAPLLNINAPEKACGKSQLLAVLGRMACRPVQANNMRPATLFRIAEKWHPALLIDECDTFIKSDAEMPGLINAGHTRDSSLVWRLVGDSHEPKAFDVWGAKALAGIALEKHLPDATMSRAIIINMRRKLAGEKVTTLRHAEAGLFDRLASKLARFAEDYAEQVRAARPALPEALSDRAQDNWEPLLAIAACAGSEWTERATKAAEKLSGASESSQSASNELLADIQHVFDSKGVAKIKTADLIAALIEDEEAAWATWNRGRPLVPRQLGRMLDGYGIRSKNIRMGYDQSKGYERQQFEDAFTRYLSAPPDLSVPAVPYPANPINTRRDTGRMEKTGTGEKTVSVPLEPAPNKAWDDGTDKNGVLGGRKSVPTDAEVF